MKKLGVVLQYELMTYLKNKSYVISTVIIALIAVIIMFVPRFIDISAITGITNSTEQNSDSDKDNSDGKSNSDKDNKADNNKDVILIYDESGVFEDVELIQAAFDDMKIEKEYFNLSESIREVLIMLENKWSVKKLSIDLELQDFLYLGSKEMMEEVWNNLIGNAIKFSDSGGQLKIKSLKNKNTVIVIISDNGIGMTKETQEKIYDKFFQADTSHSQDGAGLGLSIVKRIIAVHQGKIHIDSELNKGTTFTIDLPMLKK